MFSFFLSVLNTYKKIIMLSIIIFLYVFKSYSQNLVENGSFEQYDTCPQSDGAIMFAQGWFALSSNRFITTPDYFNSCANIYLGGPGNDVGVPKNFEGYQLAKEGVGYAGGYWYSYGLPQSRELISTKLKEPLVKGFAYNITFYLNLSNNSMCALTNLGVYFSTDSIKIPDYTNIIFKPQITCNQGMYISDTAGWTAINGIYKAKGREEYIAIGNFVNYAEVDTNVKIRSQLLPPYNTYSYYYIDDVSVTMCDTCSDVDTTKIKENNLFIPDAFSPNGDGNNDKLFVRGNNIKEVYFAVYDRWGEKVFETTDKNIGWDGSYKGNNLNGAVFVYYCFGKYNDGLEFKQKGDVTLVR